MPYMYAVVRNVRSATWCDLIDHRGLGLKARSRHAIRIYGGDLDMLRISEREKR